MIVNKTTDDLCRIAGLGGSLHVDGQQFTADDLCRIAGELNAGGNLLIMHSDRFTADDLCRIAGKTAEGATATFC